MTPIIPENLAFCSHLLQLYLQPLLNWFSDLVYNRLVVQGAEDHPLVRLQRLFDFMALEQACQPYQHVVGPGRRVIHSVPKLLRAMLVKYLLNLSLRRLEQEIRYNLVIKWFVGYSLLEEGPDHTTLHRFEAYLYREQPRLFFDTLLAQIDATVADGHEVVQMGDTFALRANAALESLLQRLRHLTHNLLHTLQAETPAMYAALAPTLDEAALFGWKKEKREYHLSTEEWQQRLFTTVQAVTACLAQLEGGCHPPAVRACIAWLQKTLADELHLVWDESGQLQDVILLPAKKRGLHRICSGSDPEATIRNHGENKKDFGYNVSVATTLDFIREIRADTGSTADVTPIPDLLTAQQTHHNTLPAKLVYDQIAGTGKTAHQVDAATNGRTQLVAKPMPPSKTDTFGPEASPSATMPSRWSALTVSAHFTATAPAAAMAGFSVSPPRNVALAPSCAAAATAPKSPPANGTSSSATIAPSMMTWWLTAKRRRLSRRCGCVRRWSGLLLAWCCTMALAAPASAVW